MNILAILAIWESVKKFNTGCKETLHFTDHFDKLSNLIFPALTSDRAPECDDERDGELEDEAMEEGDH